MFSIFVQGNLFIEQNQIQSNEGVQFLNRLSIGHMKKDKLSLFLLLGGGEQRGITGEGGGGVRSINSIHLYFYLYQNYSHT